ncbi:MAG: DUF4364 family protein [Clostridiales bacterium]|nr:DUF4364 family protein [Clostridiales bacterium]
MSQSEISDGKIHILYLVKNAPGVSYQMLMDKCLESLYLDFFTFSRCYDELIAGNLIDKQVHDTGTGEVVGNNETLVITKGGEAILEDVEATLNLQTLGYLKKASADLQAGVLETNSVKAFASPSSDADGSYVVELSTIKDGRSFTTRFKVKNKEEADTALENWRKNSSSLSDGFLGELLKSGV